VQNSGTFDLSCVLVFILLHMTASLLIQLHILRHWMEQGTVPAPLGDPAAAVRSGSWASADRQQHAAPSSQILFSSQG